MTKGQSQNRITDTKQNPKTAIGYLPKAKCSPYRTITGYNKLETELNSFSSPNCGGPPACAGANTLFQTKYFSHLKSSINGFAYSFTNVQSISVADQASIIIDAKNWAVVNTPVNYNISSIRYINDVATGTQVTYAFMNISVTYFKCGVKSPPKN